MSILGRFLLSVGLGVAPVGDPLSDPEGLAAVAPLPLPPAQGRPFDADPAQAMRGYHELLAMPSLPAVMRFEVSLRVAELELERGLVALAAFDAEGDDAARQRIAAAADGFEALIELAEAVAAPSAQRAAIHYQHARALEALGRSEASMAALRAAYAKDAAGPHAAELAFRIGERELAAQDVDAAVDAYRSAIALDDDRFALQARYRLGWAELQRLDHGASIEAFVDLLRLRFGDAEDVELAALPASARALVEDALRGLAIAVVQAGDSALLDRALASHRTSAYFHLPYAALMALLLEQERWRDAANVADRFVESAPDHPLAPRFGRAAITVWEDGGFDGRAEQARIAFADRFDPAGPWFIAEQRGDVEGVRREVREVLEGLASLDHARSQAGRDDSAAARARAVDWYQRLLRHYATDPKSGAPAAGAGRHAFLLGELHTEGSAHDAAARSYRRAAYELGPHADAVEAGYAAVLALRSAAEGRDGAEQREDIRAASHRFADAFPVDPRVPAVLLTLAEAYFAEGDHGAALAAAERIAAPVASSLQLEQALTLRAESHDARDEPARSESLWAALADASADDGARAAFRQRRNASIYAQGVRSRTRADGEAAVAHFLRLVALAPGSDEARSALYDAAVLENDRARHDRAAELFDRFAVAYPEDALADDARRGRALALQAGGRDAQAADAFEQIARRGSLAAAVRLEAWGQALELRRAAGDVTAEARALQTFVDTVFASPGSVDGASSVLAAQRLEARWRLVELARAAVPVDEPVLGARLAAVLAAAEPLAEADPRARSLAARAAFELVAPLHASYAAIALDIPLADALAEKRRALEGALAAYARAAAFGVDEIVTATTHQTGLLYAQLADALLASERPPELEADALAQYDLLLEEQAWPFEDKALELFEVNAARTRGGRWDRWIEASFGALAQRAPGRWARPTKGESLEIALHQ